MSLELEDIQVKKSNPLIQSMGTPNTLANQLLLTALVHAEMADPAHPSPIISKDDWKRIKETTNADYTKGLVAIFPQSEIRRASGRSNSGSYYQGLELALNTSPKSKAEGAKALANQWEIIINSRGVHEHVSLITASAYDSVTKTVFIKFSDEEKVQKHIYNIQKNYTILSYQRMMSFKSSTASKLYEIIKSRVDYEDSQTKTVSSEYTFTWNVSHLKFMLGVLNPFNSNETIRLLGLTNPDYDAVAAMITGQGEEVGWPKFYDFKRYVLEKAKKEINKLTEFDIDYRPGDKKGRGGKVLEVVFTVRRKTEVVGDPKKNSAADKQQKVMDDDALLEKIFEIKQILGTDYPIKDCKAIAEAADYDIDKVRTAFELLNKSSGAKHNTTGWLIKAIKENYQTKSRAGSFQNFTQQKIYNFDELEEQLLDN